VKYRWRCFGKPPWTQKNRILVKVSIDDIECDNAFQVLMDDQVQPRADFIMANGIEANLDI
jgi:DNA gyrase/topoisomerase IV subunit B